MKVFASVLLLLVSAVGCRPTCSLTLDEFVDLERDHRYCAVHDLEGHQVDWVVEGLELADTGELYSADYRGWTVYVHTDEGDGCCAPRLRKGNYRVRGWLLNVSDLSNVSIIASEIEKLPDPAPPAPTDSAPTFEGPTDAGVVTLSVDTVTPPVEFSIVVEPEAVPKNRSWCRP